MSCGFDIVSHQDDQFARHLAEALTSYEESVGPLPGIQSDVRRRALMRQLIASDRRNRYVDYVVHADLSPVRLDPSSDKFDPLKAAVLCNRAGEADEAFWMLFLFVHFGKHRVAGFRYAAEVYGRLGSGDRWSWIEVSSDVEGFREWMDANAEVVRGPGGPHGFGNHRKYESLSGRSSAGTGAVVATYVEWVGSTLTHETNFAEAGAAANGDPSIAFDCLFRSMTAIERFGRVARFDYLSMAGKLKLANVRPGSAYLVGSTGPLKGARLLFGPQTEHAPVAALDELLIELEHYLAVGFDTIEDALCNWQKSPDAFKPFRG
jgi:hypothetical protein